MRAGDAQTYIAERIRVEDRGHSSPCWVWQKCLTEKGYGRAHIPGFGHMMRVHRATYELYVGPIPQGLQIDHLCRVPACCNPEHLEAVTNAENQRRAAPFVTAVRQSKIVPCEHGATRSRCRPCHAAYMRQWYKTASPESRAKQRAAKLAYLERKRARAA